MDILDFKEGDFRELSQFFGYFAGMAFSGVSDEAIVKWFVAVNKPHQRKKHVHQAKSLGKER